MLDSPFILLCNQHSNVRHFSLKSCGTACFLLLSEDCWMMGMNFPLETIYRERSSYKCG
jgi:hypothetical protein